MQDILIRQLGCSQSLACLVIVAFQAGMWDVMWSFWDCQELKAAQSFLETHGNMVKVAEIRRAMAELHEKILAHDHVLQKMWALYCETILMACLISNNKERQMSAVLKIHQHLVSGMHGVVESMLCPALVRHSKALVE